MDINYALIGVRVRAARQKKGYTQEYISERADVSPPHYSKIESGRTKLSLPCLVRICNALEITPDEILMDSVDNSTPSLFREVATVFSGCSPDEMFHMLSVADALKKSMRVRK